MPYTRFIPGLYEVNSLLPLNMLMVQQQNSVLKLLYILLCLEHVMR